jgi:hypothetical protein
MLVTQLERHRTRPKLQRLWASHCWFLRSWILSILFAARKLANIACSGFGVRRGSERESLNRQTANAFR